MAVHRRGSQPGSPPAGGFDDAAEVEKFSTQVRAYREQRMDPEQFRRARLWNGIYGQRGLIDVQMVRAKIPQGVLRAEHLDALADIAERYSRGYGHVTTRQNIQFHDVALENLPVVVRMISSVGLTTREACGDTVRNVVSCPLAGVCPNEAFDVTRTGEEITRHFLRSPLGQDLPRKFKVALSGCGVDCGQAAINDVGLLAAARPGADGDVELGYRVVVGGGLGADPHGALILEDFVALDDVLVTVESVLRVYERFFDQFGDRSKRTHARMKFLVQRMGIDAFRAAVREERERLGCAAGTDRGRVATQEAECARQEAERARQAAALPSGVSAGSPSESLESPKDPGFARWRSLNVLAQKQPDRFAAWVNLPLGDITASQLRALAVFARDTGAELRTTIRQNLVARDLDEFAVATLWQTLAAAGLAEAHHHAAGDVVSCPGADTCSLAFTASRGLATAIRDALRAAGLAEVQGVHINISGCQNSCSQHLTGDIGLMGFARRDDEGNEAPAYRVLVGARVQDGSATFGHYAVKVAARRGPEAVVRLVSRFASERIEGESFADWVRRIGTEDVESSLADLDPLPPKREAPEFYQDWGAEAPFQVTLGRGECAS
ncbi:MAG: nitrite/sulfite reductase [Actinomycetota bacterium]